MASYYVCCFIPGGGVAHHAVPVDQFEGAHALDVHAACGTRGYMARPDEASDAAETIQILRDCGSACRRCLVIPLGSEGHE